MASTLKLTAEQEQSTELAFYADPVFAPRMEACWSMGPLSVCVDQISLDEIRVKIKLAGQTIGDGTITRDNASVCAGANVGLVKVSLCVKADFGAKEIYVEGKLCHRIWDTSWKCLSFRAKLLSW